MNFPKLDFETFGAIGAIVVSVAALFVAWDQAVVMRQEQHAGAWPYLHMEVNFQGNDEYDYIELMASNPGVGPAIVREAYLRVGDEQVANWWDLIGNTFSGELLTTLEFGGAESAMGVFAVGEERQVLRINWPRAEGSQNDAYAMFLQQAIAGETPLIGLEVCYCSVYGRCWRGVMDMNAVGRDHEQVDQCEPSNDFISTIFQDPVTDAGRAATGAPSQAATSGTAPAAADKQNQRPNQ